MTYSQQKRKMDIAASRYSTLFTLPTYPKIKIYLCLQCIATGIVTLLPFNFTPSGFTTGLLLATILLLMSLLGNYLTARILKKDLILNPRRLSFLSLASNLIISVFVLIGGVMSAFTGNLDLWFKTAAIGVFASMSLRSLVFMTVSFEGTEKILLSAIIQPTLFLATLMIIPLSSCRLEIYPFVYLTLAVLSAFTAVHFFLWSVNLVGLRILGIPSIKMFKAFLANWAEGLKEPLENALDQVSEEHTIRICTLIFKATTGNKIKAAIVVPSLHPGPFKNLGSSSIPSMIQAALGKKLGCVVSVPHGISGHSLDLASQSQNEKVLKRILETSVSSSYKAYATPFLSLKKDGVTTGSQIFGDCALLTLTLAPKTMEDLPLELDDLIIKEAKRKGLSWAVAIDAHNSLQGPFDAEKAISPLKNAITEALGNIFRLKKRRFEVGVSSMFPLDYGEEDGLGPGGISVVIVKVGNQKTAYVTIDGNNMVSGLREKILSNLQDLGINEGEIMTTDTHIVNAVVMADRGYYPVGEKIPPAKLIEYIMKVTTEAIGNLEPTEVSWRKEEIEGVRIIGEKQIEKFSLMVDKAAKKAKYVSSLVFPVVGILLTILLIIL